MKKSILFLAFVFCSLALQAQSSNYNLAEGDILILGEPSGSEYRNIDFPRKNIIIKRGAIADFNALIGKKLVVQQISNTKNGKAIAILKRKDDLNFF